MCGTYYDSYVLTVRAAWISKLSYIGPGIKIRRTGVTTIVPTAKNRSLKRARQDAPAQMPPSRRGTHTNLILSLAHSPRRRCRCRRRRRRRPPLLLPRPCPPRICLRHQSEGFDLHPQRQREVLGALQGVLGKGGLLPGGGRFLLVLLAPPMPLLPRFRLRQPIPEPSQLFEVGLPPQTGRLPCRDRASSRLHQGLGACASKARGCSAFLHISRYVYSPWCGSWAFRLKTQSLAAVCCVVVFFHRRRRFGSERFAVVLRSRFTAVCSQREPGITCTRRDEACAAPCRVFLCYPPSPTPLFATPRSLAGFECSAYCRHATSPSQCACATDRALQLCSWSDPGTSGIATIKGR